MKNRLAITLLAAAGALAFSSQIATAQLVPPGGGGDWLGNGKELTGTESVVKTPSTVTIEEVTLPTAE